MKKIKVFFQILLVSPFIIFLLFSRIFFKVKIVEFETRRIGHSSLPMEIFLCERLNGLFGKNNIYFSYRNTFVSNKYLFNKLKKNFILFPSFILKPIFLFFNYKLIYTLVGQKFVSDYRHWSKRTNYNETWQENDVNGVLKKTLPIIKFNNQEVFEGNKYLRELGIRDDDQYVCFHHRSPHYYLNKMVIEEFKYNLRDIRNFNYNSAYKYLLSKKNKIVQMGFQNEKNNQFNIINYDSEKINNSFLDIYLVFGCKYMITDGAGIANVALMNRKKRLYINFSGIYNINISDSYYTPFIMPKKFKSLKSGKLISYSEVLEKKLSNFLFVKDLNEFGYDIIDNDNEEIYQASLEMDQYIENGKKEYLNEDYQIKFNKLLNKFNIPELKESKISSYFLSKNIDLIN